MIDCLYDACEKCRNHEPCYDNITFCKKTLAKHDAKVRADVIEEYRKEMHDIIEGNEEFTDWQKYDILECNELVAEQLKGSGL